jgi:hypothetical protein
MFGYMGLWVWVGIGPAMGDGWVITRDNMGHLKLGLLQLGVVVEFNKQL